MSLLRSLFSFRGKHQGGHDDAEKPFLDHLEDLRVTLMKMGTVLMIAMIAAFCFRNQLTLLLEEPLKAVEAATVSSMVPEDPRTEKEKELFTISSIAVKATARVLEKTLTPEEIKRLATAVFVEHRAALEEERKKDGKGPIVGSVASLQTLDVTESFSIALKLSFYAGIVISFPFLLYFVIGFVLPALTRKEKRLLGPGILGGSLLFAFGVWICFIFILPKTLIWFHNFNSDLGFVANWKAATYFGFVTHLCLACGFLCELPLVMVVLSVLGVLSFDLLTRTRRYAVAIILILVAIISPTPDPMTFITLAIPMLAIFEGSIWLVWLIERRRAKAEVDGGHDD